MRRLDGGARMRRLREGDERTAQPPGGDGAPLGGTMTSRQELADGGPPKHAVARSAARCRKTPRWRAGGRRIFPKGRCATELLTRLLGAPSPRILRGTEWDDGVPGAAKNTGDFAWPARRSVAKAGCLTFESARRRGRATRSLIPPLKGEGGSARSAESGGATSRRMHTPPPAAFGGTLPRKRGRDKQALTPPARHPH
jgi:hypothetical protein